MASTFDVRFDKLDQRIDLLDNRIDLLDTRMERVEQTVDKVLVMSLDAQDRLKTLEEQFGFLADQIQSGFGRMDQFLTILNRHDVEIVSCTSAYHRLDDRVTVLETK